MREIGIPVLQDALDRSLLLAAGMDSRGYGRIGNVARRTRMLTGALLLAGLVGVATGVYGLLDASTPRALGVPMLFAGLLVAGAGFVLSGRRVERTVYRPDPWALAEWLVAASGITAAVVMVVAGHVDPANLNPVAGTAALARAAAAPGARDPRRRAAGVAGATGRRPLPASAGRRARRSVRHGPRRDAPVPRAAAPAPVRVP